MSRCAICKDSGIVGGVDLNGPDARWCNCMAAANQRNETPGAVEQLNQWREKLRQRYLKKPQKMKHVSEVQQDEPYNGEF